MPSSTPQAADCFYENAGNPPLLELLPLEPGRILDCGCGAGDNARLLRERGWQVDGVTLSEAESAAAAGVCERVFVADLEEGVPAAAGAGYDAVLLSHVLEHLVRPERLLQSARGVLAPGGLVGVALPNVAFYRVRAELLLGRFDYSDYGILDRTHLRFYTFASGRALLERSGFEVLTARAHGAVPLWALRSWLPEGSEERLAAWACAWRPGLFGRQCLYLARPAGS